MTDRARSTGANRRAVRTVRIAGLLGALLLAAGCAAAPQQAAPAGTPAPGAPAAAPASTAPAVHTVRISSRGGQVTGDTGTVPITLGENVQIVVISDVADEVHLHGYDIETRLQGAGPSSLSFVADIPGEFELELHGSGAQLATLQVR